MVPSSTALVDLVWLVCVMNVSDLLFLVDKKNTITYGTEDCEENNIYEGKFKWTNMDSTANSQ
jgi:hypothetical protein